MSFNTGNELPSLDERDLYDNALNLDKAMNSTDPTWTDRFGVEKPTIDTALKSTGFMPAGFDFVTGGTLQPGDRNKAVYNPAPNGDNNWYRWNGAFPKEIAANSQPNPKDENNWVPVLIKTSSVEREALRRTYLEAGYNLVPGSFEQGAVITSATDVVLHEKTGKCYSGPIGNVSAGTNPTVGGQFVDVSRVTSVSGGFRYVRTPKPFGSGFLLTDVNQVVLHSDGMWYYYTGTLPHANTEPEPIFEDGWRNAGLLVGDKYNSPLNYGAKGDGVTGDAVAIGLAIKNNNDVDMTSLRWRIEDTIIVGSRKNIRVDGSVLILDCAGKVAFKTEEGSQLISFTGRSSLVLGEALAFIQLSGKTDSPTVFEDYTRLVNLIGLTLSSQDIEYSLIFDKCVNGVTIDGCRFTTRNAILSNGKSVEIHCSNSIFFGWSVAGSVGIKITSSGNGNSFSEGWHFVNCSMDAFETTIKVRDIFVLTIANSWLTSKRGGKVLEFDRPATLSNASIVIGGCAILGEIFFNDSPGGYNYDAKINSCTFTAFGRITIGRECAGIDIDDVSFKNGSGYAIRFPTTFSTTAISITKSRVDGTYTGIVENFSNYSGGVCVKDCKGKVSSTLAMKEDSAYSMLSSQWTPRFAVSASSMAGVSVSTNEFLFSTVPDFPSGAHGIIKGQIRTTSATVNGLAFKVYLDGSEMISGTGWSTREVYAANGLAIIDIPIFIPESYQGVKLLSVQYVGAGSITTAQGSYIRLEKS
ncbi:putative tail fiber protein [Aeromonas phage ACP1]